MLHVMFPAPMLSYTHVDSVFFFFFFHYTHNTSNSYGILQAKLTLA